MERWRNRVAVVTGASSGIGAAVCGLLAEHGMRVVGCARRIDKIEELARDAIQLFIFCPRNSPRTQQAPIHV